MSGLGEVVVAACVMVGVIGGLVCITATELNDCSAARAARTAILCFGLGLMFGLILRMIV